jgi:hypothetical protein
MVLTQTELDRLQALAKGGGKVLFLGKTPSIISGKTILDARAATPADFAFATVETSAQLPPTPTPPAQAPATPPGPQAVPPAIEAALNQVMPVRRITLDSPETALRISTRYLKDANVYLFFNESAKPISHKVSILSGIPGGYTGIITGPGPINLNAPLAVESWDPASGAISSVPWSMNSLQLDLRPYETKLIMITARDASK